MSNTQDKKDLFQLIKENEVEEVRQLLNLEYEKGKIRPNSGSLLDTAILHSNMEMVRLLVSYGMKTLRVHWIVDCAKKEDAYERISFLLPKLQKWLYEYYTTLYPLSDQDKESLKEVIYNKRPLKEDETTEILKKIKLPDRLTEVISMFKSRLYSALGFGADNYRFVEYLINQGVLVDYDKYENPLYYAAESGNIEVARLLLEKGASLNEKVPFHHDFAIQAAIKKHHLSMVQFLLDYVDEEVDKLKTSFLLTAIDTYERLSEEQKEEKKKALSIITFLLESKCSDMSPGKNPSSVLCSVYSKEVLDLFEPYIDSLSQESQKLFYEKRLPFLFSEN